MAGLTKEQRAAKLLSEKIAAAGLTPEQFDALNDDEKAQIVGSKPAVDTSLGGATEGDEDADDGIKYVRMTRDPEIYDAPHEAKVHPHEVSSFARGGWELP